MVLSNHRQENSDEDGQSILVNELSALNQSHNNHHSNYRDISSSVRINNEESQSSSMNLRLSRYTTSSWLFITGIGLLVLIVFNNYDKSYHHHQEASIPIPKFDTDYVGQQGFVSSAAADALGISNNEEITKFEEDGIALQTMGLESSGHHHSKNQDSVTELLKNTECMKDKMYSSTTVKTAFEIPFVGLFEDTKGEKKFEASSLIKVNCAI